MDTARFDDLDQALIQALHLHHRAPFRLLGEVLGVSDQTVARRYRRLREEGGAVVLGRLDARRVGAVDWLLRLQCTPDAATAVAGALAQRDDTSWIRLASGGTEVQCAAQLHSPEQRDALLLRKLPGTRQVTAVSAHWLLHLFRGGRVPWTGTADMLTAAQADALRAAAPPAPAIDAPAGEVVALDADDRRLVSALVRDGRLGFAELAATTGLHESTVRRRIEHLQATGALHFVVDADSMRYGITAQAMLYMSVAPAELAAVGEALAGHAEVPFVAATTGPHNLVASVACRDAHALYEFLTLGVGRLDGVDSVETVPMLRTFKRGVVHPRRAA